MLTVVVKVEASTEGDSQSTSESQPNSPADSQGDHAMPILPALPMEVKPEVKIKTAAVKVSDEEDDDDDFLADIVFMGDEPPTK